MGETACCGDAGAASGSLDIVEDDPRKHPTEERVPGPLRYSAGPRDTAVATGQIRSLESELHSLRETNQLLRNLQEHVDVSNPAGGLPGREGFALGDTKRHRHQVPRASSHLAEVPRQPQLQASQRRINRLHPREGGTFSTSFDAASQFAVGARCRDMRSASFPADGCADPRAAELEDQVVRMRSNVRRLCAENDELRKGPGTANCVSEEEYQKLLQKKATLQRARAQQVQEEQHLRSGSTTPVSTQGLTQTSSFASSLDTSRSQMPLLQAQRQALETEQEKLRNYMRQAARVSFVATSLPSFMVM